MSNPVLEAAEKLDKVICDARHEAQSYGSRAAVDGFEAAMIGVLDALTGACRALVGVIKAE